MYFCLHTHGTQYENCRPDVKSKTWKSKLMIFVWRESQNYETHANLKCLKKILHHHCSAENLKSQSGVYFTNMFTKSFYAPKSKKPKKTVKSSVWTFCTFGIFVRKSYLKKVAEIDTWSWFFQHKHTQLLRMQILCFSTSTFIINIFTLNF